MFETVQIPVWLISIVALLAAVSALERILVPSVRWFFRRRMERVVARLNERLERPIEPFKLARRHDMIQRLIYDPKVAEAVAEQAKEDGIPENVAFEAAHRYAREIVPSFSATAYFGFATRITRWLSRGIYRVRIAYRDEKSIAEIEPSSTVVYVMNHRSNMDYFLVTYLAAERTALSYAVGEWARVWPLQGLLRFMGAYFIRRKSNNVLYRRVLGRYVQMATEAGVGQAVFPEGGLSLTGEVKPPKLGILNYVISGYHGDEGRDVVFVPVALNYDRVLEDRVLIEAATAGGRKFRFGPFSMLGFVFRQIRFFLTGRFHRFGYAAVSFGSPLSLREFSKDMDVRSSEELTKNVGRELMARVRQEVPVLPVPLVAYILCRAQEPLAREEVEAQLVQIVEKLRDCSAQVHLPRDNTNYATQVGLRMLLLRQFIREDDSGMIINEKSRDLVEYYAKSIAHIVDAEIDERGDRPELK
ncbi:1-acyl-sn-glycerol-3-phosphate acyltransferase [Falsihalocynthiibacter sp. SS001]|uniref:1-acyl-sn-glycerol-3-phosphate acyltransferase n=1 Tax=Falsihalocynthiibacter sp. SS001 TaxID=3349698 RepID=UPI0036D3C700